tara:strand:+ start:272 stop:478 length:207 start_codon:yes stop_codon:yes gene_type:complete
MARVSQILKADKKAKSRIKVDVQKTIVTVVMNNISLALTDVEARRLNELLTKAVAIQETKRIEITPML